MIKLTPIKPRTSAANFRKVEAAVKGAYQQATQELLADFNKTTATWRTPVRWVVTAGPNGVTVRTDNAIYTFVDKGTRPHLIRARRAKVLAFATGGQAKTRPGSIIAGPGGAGSGTAFAQEVQHPGGEARGFSRRLRAKWKAKWPKLVQQAVSKAVKA